MCPVADAGQQAMAARVLAELISLPASDQLGVLALVNATWIAMRDRGWGSDA
jgi:hypothetical protein